MLPIIQENYTIERISNLKHQTPTKFKNQRATPIPCFHFAFQRALVMMLTGGGSLTLPPCFNSQFAPIVATRNNLHVVASAGKSTGNLIEISLFIGNRAELLRYYYPLRSIPGGKASITTSGSVASPAYSPQGSHSLALTT